jgi:rhamnosyltransferase
MKVFSVIVSYYPDVKKLSQLCQVLIDNNSSIILIDNTEKSCLSEYLDFPECTLIALGENTGIAHAQNIGIRHAAKCGAEVIVFFDQDSKIEKEFLPSLLSPLKPGKPGVVAPIFFDNVKGYEFPSFRLNRCGLPYKIFKENKSMPYDVDIITSSGTAATLATFDIAGLMDEDLFIDLVDTEWSLRCRKKNIPIQVVPTAVMRHSIGETSINYGFMRSFVHSPERCYYQIRNCFILFRKQGVPVLMASKEIISAFIHHIILIAFVKNRILYIKNFYFAVLHGIRGVVGKRPI